MDPLADVPTQLGILRLEIAGRWSVTDFVDLLTRTTTVFSFVNSLDFFSRAISAKSEYGEKKGRTQEIFFGTVDYFPLRYHRDTMTDPGRDAAFAEFITNKPWDLSEIEKLAEAHTGQLTLNSISYSSPGWAEVLASLNPLRVICNAILEWRRINLEHRRVENEHQIRLVSMRTAFAKEMLESIATIAKDKNFRTASRQEELFQRIEAIVNLVEEIARDTRLTGCSVTPIALPPGKPS